MDPQGDAPEPRYLAFDGRVLDMESRQLWKDGASQYLTPRTFETLQLLLRHAGDVVSKDTLLAHAWPGTVVTENALTRVIKEIRQALDDPARAPRFVETVPRLGYRFLVEVRPLAEFEPGTGPGSGANPGMAPGTASESTASAETTTGVPGSTTTRATNAPPSRGSGVFRWLWPATALLALALVFFYDDLRHPFTDEAATNGTVGPPSGIGAEAYLEYVQGRELLVQRSEVERRRAVEHFRRAIELEPEYADAWSGLADALISLDGFLAPRSVLFDALEAARRGLELDSDNTQARVSLARLEGEYGWDFEAAESGFQQALADQPSYLPAYQEYAILLTWRGRYVEALDWLAQARALDPLDPATPAITGWVLLMAGRTAEARSALDTALALDPDLVITHLNLGLLELRLEDATAAAGRFAQAVELAGPSPDLEGLLGYSEARAGQTAAARARLAELEQRATTQYVTPMATAMIHLGLGELDAALERLRAAYGDRNWHLIMLREHFLFDDLRGMEGFEALVGAVERGGSTPAGDA